MEIVLAIAILTVPVMANSFADDGGLDILGKYGIFETEDAAFKFPGSQDTNVDAMTVGNDKAIAFGNIWQKSGLASAINNLEIKKNQDSGGCECCVGAIADASSSCHQRNSNVSPCKDCCSKVNIDQINVGNRAAMAFGFGKAANYVKIVTNQK